MGKRKAGGLSTPIALLDELAAHIGTPHDAGNVAGQIRRPSAANIFSLLLEADCDPAFDRSDRQATLAADAFLNQRGS
jgi:hypothetical protein